MLRINASNCENFVKQHELEYLLPQCQLAYNQLIKGEGPGNDFIGWYDLPENYDKEEFSRLLTLAKKVREEADILVVVGIGGSYLGTRAVLEALSSTFQHLSLSENSPLILFAGQNISAKYHSDLLKILEGKSVYLNVISKSGTTTEPAIAFRILKQYMEERYGLEEASKRIIATTDKSRGALKTLAIEEGYETFVVPDNVGGRFSVLTPVGLLPLACAGIDVESLIKGAQDQKSLFDQKCDLTNASCYYAMLRTALLRKQYTTEILVNYEPSLHMISEWWKQLYGESEGKDQKGLFPASVDFSTDLHSMGQFIQDGKRNLFETTLFIEDFNVSLKVPEDKKNLDKLNFLAGKEVSFVNEMAMKGTILAHVDGNVPNIQIVLEKMDAYNLGQLLYFFETACALSAYMNAVNPFDQPGVEAYKKNMFALLGKEGYEEEGKKLLARLN